MNSYFRIVKGALAMVLAVGILSSCGGNTAQENQNMGSEIELHGLLLRSTEKDAPSEFALQRMSDGQSVYLTSTEVSLEKFFNTSVYVYGAFTDQEKKVFAVKRVTEEKNENSATLLPQTKSYQNTQMGIKFSYPPSWEVEETTDTKITIKDSLEKTTVLVLNIFQLPSGQTLGNWIGKNYPSEEVRDTDFAGVDAKKILKTDATEVIVLMKNQRLYKMEFTPQNGREGDHTLVKDLALISDTFGFFLPMEEKTNENMNISDFNSQENENSSTRETEKEKEKDIPPQNSNTVSEDARTALSTPNTVLSYLKDKNYMLTGELASGVTKVELAEGKYAYVTFNEGESTKKVVYSYTSDAEGALKLQEKGLFELDPATSKWKTVSGANPAPSSKREVYTIKQGQVSEKKEAPEGKNLYSNASTKVSIAYPKNWYYAGGSLSEKGGIQQITFSTKPLEEESGEQVVLKVYKSGSLDTGTSTTVGGVEARKVETSSGVMYVVTGKDGNLYAASGSDTAQVGEILQGVTK